MNKTIIYYLFYFSLFSNFLCTKEIVLPLRPDPPPSIDGDLLEWQMSSFKINLNTADKAVVGKKNWNGPQDLSASIIGSWDEQFLYFAISVQDDIHMQEHRGKSLFNGDHIELFIDTVYKKNQDAGSFGPGQFQLGFSPGNFKKTKNILTDIPTEFFIWHPLEVSGSPVRLAASRTAKGYEIEAAIPWDVLKIKPKQGLLLGIDICISDTDVQSGGQQSVLSMLNSPWKLRDRGRLLPVLLGDTQGRAVLSEEIPTPINVQEEAVIGQGEAETLEFDVRDTNQDYNTILSFQARAENKGYAGGSHFLKIFLNEKEVTSDYLINRGKQFSFANGKIIHAFTSKGFFLYYAPNFNKIPESCPYFSPDTEVMQFEFKVNDFIQKGENVLKLHHCSAASAHVAIAALKIIHRGKSASDATEKTTDVTPLSVIKPEQTFKVPYTVKITSGGAIKINLEDQQYIVESSFTEPGCAVLVLNDSSGTDNWKVRPGASTVIADGKYYSLHRQIIAQDECIEVRDTFTSKTTENTGIILRHEVKVETMNKLYLAGLSPYSLSGVCSEPQNPTTIMISEKGSLGLMPEDDVFRVHSQNYCQDKTGGIADNQFVLRGGSSYTFKWSVYPSKNKTYFDIINSIRRKTGVNFSIKGSFSFIAPREATLTNYPNVNTPTEKIVQWLNNKSARYAVGMIGYDKYKNLPPHGTSFPLTVNREKYKNFFAKVRTAPGVLTGIYFHCFISVREGDKDDYRNARILLPNGQQGDYRNPIYPMYFPTLENSYGKAIAKNVDIILDEIGCDGVYWDEMDVSAHHYHFGDPWDGFSGIIDPVSYTINGYKSSVALLSNPWRIKMVQRILKAGKFLIANGAPITETMAALHFPRFVETGSISASFRSHLYTPIALGDHLTEKNELDAYKQMVISLDYGMVYYWYADKIWPTHKTLTEYMFPITPMELHKGHIIGKERILANHSGIYGWGDNSTHEVHVFNDLGIEIPWPAKTVENDGMKFTEVRLPAGYAVAIVRKSDSKTDK